MAMPIRQRALYPVAMDAGSEPSSPTSADADAYRLCLAVARGDQAAFEELYDRYYDRLLRLVLVLSQGDEAIARDVVQSAMLTVAAKLKAVKTEEHLWHWLARVARQHLIKEWRHRRTKPMLVGLAELPETTEIVQPDAVLEESLDTAMLTLEEADRQIIEWFYFDHLSQKEIAARLDTTPKAVSSRLERARAKLRSSLTRILSHET